MNNLFIIALILIVAVILVIFRVSTLVGIVRGETKKQVPTSNKIQAVLLLVFMIVGIIAFFYYSFFGGVKNFVQPLASEHGAVTDNLFWITMVITVFVFIVTQIFLFGFAYKYQYKEGNQADFYPHNNKLEIIWTVIPAIVLAILIFSGLRAWNKFVISDAPEGTEVIEVMGFQFGWSFRYGGSADGELGKYDFRKIDAVNAMGLDLSDKRNFDDVITNQLIIPKGRPIKLSIRARDVIHSVYNPHFRIQMNAVPGHPTSLWFTATKSTDDMRSETGNPEFDYELVCNKICGKSHFGMRAVIKVLEEDEYQEWYASQNAWLQGNSDYLEMVPEDLREAAKIAAMIEEEEVEVEMPAEDEASDEVAEVIIEEVETIEE